MKVFLLEIVTANIAEITLSPSVEIVHKKVILTHT